MRIGVPKEIKVEEYRVGLTPESVHSLVGRGHQVLVETGAGAGIGAGDEIYEEAGATIVADAAEAWKGADLVVKVKEPQPSEYPFLRSDLTLFTYLHLAADPDQAKALMAAGTLAIAYETVEDKKGRLPLLAPMSQVAGRMAVQAAAHFLERENGGRGILLSGVPGVEPARVVIIGGGTVGRNAARIAVGMGADVTILQRSADNMVYLDDLWQGRLKTVYSEPKAIDRLLPEADVVIGAVLIPGAGAPKLIRREHLKTMKPGSVIVDVAIDQGGCCETSRPTTHSDPVYTVDGVIHYCVANMPGAVPRTSAHALNHATLPYVLQLADKGPDRAVTDDPGLAKGVNVKNGVIVYNAVAEALSKV